VGEVGPNAAASSAQVAHIGLVPREGGGGIRSRAFGDRARISSLTSGDKDGFTPPGNDPAGVQPACPPRPSMICWPNLAQGDPVPGPVEVAGRGPPPRKLRPAALGVEPEKAGPATTGEKNFRALRLHDLGQGS